MKRGLLASALAASLFFVLGGCTEGHPGGETDVVGRVVLGGTPVASANVRIIFAGFVQDTEATAADGTFVFGDYPEEWDPFFVEAFYVDPVTLNEYFGSTPFFFTDEHGPTDIGDIVLVQAFPATAGNGGSGDLDGDGIEDVAVIETGQALVALSSGGGHSIDGTFGSATVADVDGDGFKDVVLTSVSGIETWNGDGKGGLTRGP